MKFKHITICAALCVFSIGANAQSVTGTTASSALSNAGSNSSNTGVSAGVDIRTYGSHLPTFTLALTTAVNYTPSPAASLSQASCAGFETKGGTLGFISAANSTMVDGHQCDGLLNGQHMGQMADNARALGNAYLTQAKAFVVPGPAHNDGATENLSAKALALFQLADRLDRAHMNLFCRQDAAVYASLRYEGLCDDIDWDHYKTEFTAPTNGAQVSRAPAVASLDGMQLGK